MWSNELYFWKKKKKKKVSSPSVKLHLSVDEKLPGVTLRDYSSVHISVEQRVAAKAHCIFTPLVIERKTRAEVGV